MIKHPAKYSNEFIPIFAKILIENNCHKILDPFAGVGKISQIRQYGYDGKIYANEIEADWANEIIDCNVTTIKDAEFLSYPNEYFDAIVTSPTYGNRMADHHLAKDNSKRNTYTHCIGHQLNDGNTGKMQFGKEYCEKHEKIYTNLCPMIKNNGMFILNVSNHIRKGSEVDVVSWHIDAILTRGFILEQDIKISTKRNKFGANSEKRVEFEHILVFRKNLESEVNDDE